MIISKEKGFVFIHVWKTAGSSFRQILEQYSESTLSSKILRRLRFSQSIIRDPHKHAYDVHATFADLESCFEPEELSNLFSFAIVRNPWDWHVSLYHYMQQQRTHYQRDLAISLEDFGDYLRWRSSEEPIDQRHFITNGDGDIAIDYIGRFEALGEVLEVLRSELDLSLNLPYVRKSVHEDFRSYYKSDWMVQCVQDMNQKDIEDFGYAFS